MTGLKIAAGVELSLDYVTKTAAILAQRRKGKTYTASVIAEELVDNRIPFVAIDPTGAWWGLRSASDGNSAGLPVVVLGGKHGDLPLEVDAGKFIADLVLDHPGYFVLDLSSLESRAAERRFAIAFAQRLYRRKLQPGMDFPLHLFVDEADLFVPQEKEGRADVEMLGAFQAIVRRGGLAGLGTTLISQRPALVNKSVLTQLDLLVLLRLVAGNDQDAVDKNYISRSSTKEQRAELMDSLASLKVGEAWLFEPGSEPPLFARVQIRERRTFNSSATPKPGEKRIEPKVLAAVDLEALEAQMRDAVDRAKADDPAELRRQIKDLRTELADRERQLAAKPAGVEETIVEIPTIIDGDLDRLEAVALDTRALATEVAAAIESGVRPLIDALYMTRPRPPFVVASVPKVEPVAPPAEPRAQVPEAGDGPSEYVRGILETIARRHPMKVTRSQISMLSGRRPRSSTFGAAMTSIVRDGWAFKEADLYSLTEAGLAIVGNVVPSSNGDVLETWRAALSDYDRSLFDVLIAAGTAGVPRPELAERAGWSPTSSSFSAGITNLTKNGLARVENGYVYVVADLLA